VDRSPAPLPLPGPDAGRCVAHRRRIARHDGLREDEAGQGLVGAVAGVIVFLAFLLLAVHLVISLYATTTVTSSAYDAARAVAAADIDHADPAAVAAAQRQAERDARANLGGYAERVEPFDWSGTDADVVRLRIRADNPSFLIYATGGLGLDVIDRTVTVRVERVR
jgi:hypothetical protein